MSVYLSHHDDVSMAFEVWAGATPLEPGLLREPIDLRLDPPPDRSGWIHGEIERLIDECAFADTYLSDIDPASLSVCYQCNGAGGSHNGCAACKGAGRVRCNCPDCRKDHECVRCRGTGFRSKPCGFCGGSGKKWNYNAFMATSGDKHAYGLDPSLVSVAERVLGRCVWRCVVRAGLPWWFGVSEIGAVLLMPCRNVVLPMRPATPDEVTQPFLVVRSSDKRLGSQRFNIRAVKP